MRVGQDGLQSPCYSGAACELELQGGHANDAFRENPYRARAPVGHLRGSDGW
jgi:hypothetical protein